MSGLTTADLIGEVRALAKEFPKCVYDSSNGCRYTKGKCENGPDSEGCIIGQAAVRAGGDLTKFEDYTTQGIKHILHHCNIVENRKEYWWLNEVQKHQDDGTTWEYAVKVADATCPIR